MSTGRAVAWVFVLGGSAVVACVLPSDIVGGTSGGLDGEGDVADGAGTDGPAEPCGGLTCTCGSPSCHQTCATSGEGNGGCIFGCDGEKDCHFECMGGACQSACTNGATCQYDCLMGSCIGDCTNAASCTNTCPAGSCQIDCNDTDVCELSCAGGSCSMSCNGASVCRITDCENSCILDCNGAPDCQNSCDGSTSCVTRP